MSRSWTLILASIGVGTLAAALFGAPGGDLNAGTGAGLRWVAGDYADVRAGYADELVTAVFDYLGRVPERVVEPGAGTGKLSFA